MTTLTRTAVEVPTEPSIDPVREQLASRAASVLGYGLLRHHLATHGTATEVRRKTMSVAQVFEELDIKPFANADVEKYQAEEVARMNVQSRKELPRWVRIYLGIDVFLDRILTPLMPSRKMTARAAFFVLGCVVTALAECAFLIKGQWVAAGIAAPFAALGWLMIYAMALADSIKRHTAKEWSWQQLTFEECTSRGIQIPEFALQTAVSVKERMPGANLYVEALVSQDRSLGDPFLTLEHGEKYRLEVWNEAAFEARPIA